MKKTIITLLALSASVYGATVGPVDTTDSTLKTYFNFETGNSQTAGSMSGWNEKLTWNEDGQYGTTSQSHTMYAENLSLNLGNSGGLTVSFDIKNLTREGTVLTISNGAVGDGWKALLLSINKNEETQGYTLTSTVGTLTLSANIGNLTDWTTVTVVATTVDKTYGSETCNVDLYVDGTLANATTSPWGAHNFVRDGLNKVQMGYWGNGDNSGYADFDNVLIYGRAMSASEIKGLVIPEPATATLSLLALAGLAARRRRK